jgi:hypothetical protein
MGTPLDGCTLPCATAAKQALSDLCRCVLGIERQKARGSRGLRRLEPFIVVCRKVQQSSLGKLVGVLREEATTFGMRFQKIRIHGNTPLNISFKVLHSASY